MNARAQAGLVQLGIAALLVAAWYSGAWSAIVDELTAGVTGGERRFGLPAASAAGAGAGPAAVGGIPAPSLSSRIL